MTLTYTKPHKLAQLYDELVTAIPALLPQDGVAILYVEGSGDDITISFPDDTGVTQAQVDAVVTTHVPKEVIPQPTKEERLNAIEAAILDQLGI
jgi:hypothetical protein